MKRIVATLLLAVGALFAIEPEPKTDPGVGTSRTRIPRMVEHAFLGVVVEPIDDPVRRHLAAGRGVGLLVTEVSGDSPAAAAGLAADDILIRLDDQLLVLPEQLRILVQRLEPGTEVRLTYLHDGEETTTTAALAAKEQVEWKHGWPGRGGPFSGTPRHQRGGCPRGSGCHGGMGWPHCRRGAGDGRASGDKHEPDVGFSIAIEDSEIVCRDPDGEAFWRAPFSGLGGEAAELSGEAAELSGEAAEIGTRMRDAVRERLEDLARRAEKMAARAREHLGSTSDEVEESFEERFERMQKRQENLEERIEELLERLGDEEN